MDALTIASWCAGVAGVALGVVMRWRAVRAETRAAGLRAELEAERRASVRDPLTGLLNRRGFFRSAATVADDAARWPVTAIVVDLDRFKELNDVYGHAVGDEVLVTVAQRLAAFAGEDPVARFGGDEFVALLGGTGRRDGPGAGGPGPADLEGLVDLVAAPIPVAGGWMSVAASIGSHPVASSADLAAALHLADGAMYRTKQARRAGDGRITQVRAVARPADRAPRAVESAAHGHGTVVA